MSLSKMLKLCACFILDVALIVSFTYFFALYSLLDPAKSTLMLIVLLCGLAIWNLIILAPREVMNKLGIVYSVFVLSLLAIYPFVAIITSILLLPVNAIWYFTTQLLIAFVFIMIVAIILPFGKKQEAEREASEQVVAAGDRLSLLLMQIDDVVEDHAKTASYSHLNDQFNRLKERLRASTPFSKVNQKIIVSEMEREIIDELHTLYQRLKPEQIHNFVAIQATMDHIQKLVKHREQLLIK
ncbi:MAG TPA: hypothetical protein IAA29_00825 [Candidatus Paenibacillus intestinavium]|nr:hypothetical protein [Candidatus Paenibacillus intestinavium]